MVFKVSSRTARAIPVSGKKKKKGQIQRITLPALLVLLGRMGVETGPLYIALAGLKLRDPPI